MLCLDRDFTLRSGSRFFSMEWGLSVSLYTLVYFKKICGIRTLGMYREAIVSGAISPLPAVWSPPSRLSREAEYHRRSKSKKTDRASPCLVCLLASSGSAEASAPRAKSHNPSCPDRIAPAPLNPATAILPATIFLISANSVLNRS